MDFGVLGPLVVTTADGEVKVGGPRQRRLLAVLTLHAGEVVSTDRLIDVVFAGAPPDGAETTIRSYVARLRRSLSAAESGADGLVETRPPGYSLQIDPADVDGERFAAAAALGRRQLADRDAMGAVVTLRDALAMWRGSAYDEFLYEDWARAEASRLEELRTAAEEVLVDAQLACGLAEEVIPRLRRLIDDHPLRERLQAQLMLALHRSGRQAEALRAFEAHRERLIEAGLEPSSHLVALEGSIAVHDPSLLLAAPAGRALRGYRLGDTLGEGRHGVVYRAVQPGVGRDVAVKAIRMEFADDPAFIRRFDAEAQIVSHLEHPHIVPCYDFWREPGGAYLVMRLLAGDLSGLMDSGPVSAPAVAQLTQQIGSALVAAHRSGIVHGDIKPSNVLVDGEGNAYLSDFGVASMTRGSAAPEPYEGTGYASPERLAGGPATEATDQFALAVLLVQAMTGLLPFGRRAIASASDRVASIHMQRPRIPSAVDAVVWKATSWDPERRHSDVATFVEELLSALGGAAPDTARARRVVNPYKGLRPFAEADAARFFGRDTIVDELLARLGRSDDPGRFVTLIGASGSGKSSIVRAGLLPRLRSGGVVGSEDWFVATMVPGSDPFAELEASMRSIAVTRSAVDQGAHAVDGKLVGRLLRAGVPTSQPVLLVIDQLEELFTVVTDEAVRGAFLAGVARAVSDAESELRIVATLRADFYDRPLRYQRFGQLLSGGGITVGAMSSAELQEAVTGPAALQGVEVEPALATEIVTDVVDQPAALPLLQFTLAELFDRRPGSVMTLESYRGLGGVDAAVAGRADRVYCDVQEADRDLVRRLFLRLVAVRESGQATSRRSLRSELVVLAADPEKMERLIVRLTDARLLTLDRDPTTRAPTVEVAHEALISQWPQLASWLAEAGDGLRIQEHLHDSAGAWDQTSRDPGDLYRGARLEAALDWVGNEHDALSPAEHDFLAASVSLRDAEKAAEWEHLDEQRRANRRLRVLLASIGLLLVGALIAGFVAVDQRNSARDESGRADAAARVATVRELTAASLAALDDDPELSILLALEAVEESGGPVLPEAEEALHRAVLGSRLLASVPNGGNGIAHFSPDGIHFLTRGDDARVAQLWSVDPVEPGLALVGHDSDVFDAVFSADGNRMATTSADGTVRIWDAATGVNETTFELEGPPPVIPSFSNDGRLLAATSFGGVTHVWDVDSERRRWSLPGPGPDAFALNLAFSPDDSMLAVAQQSDTEGVVGAALWDIATGELVRTFEGHTAAVNDVGFSPDGSVLYTASADATVREWDVETGENTGTFVGHEASVIDLQVAGDGGLIASSGLVDVLVWDPSTLEVEARIVGHAGEVDGIDLSADGSLLVTASGVDSTTRLWDLAPDWSHELVALPGPDFLLGTTYPAGAVEFSPGGDTLAAAAAEGSVTLWSMPEGREIRTLGGPGPAVFSLAYSADGSRLAAAGLRGVGVYDTATGEELAHQLPGTETNNVVFDPDGSRLVAAGEVTISLPLPDADGVDFAPGGSSFDVAVSPDGTLIAVSGESEAEEAFFVTIFDGVSGEPVTSLPTEFEGDVTLHESDVLGLAFSPDGELLATSGSDALGVVWDTTTFEPTARLEGHTGAISNVAFDPVRNEIATASADGTVRLWNVDSGATRLTLPGPVPFSDVAYSPDGRLLAASSPFGVVMVYMLDIDELVAEAETRLTRGLTPAECVQYLHTGCP